MTTFTTISRAFAVCILVQLCCAATSLFAFQVADISAKLASTDRTNIVEIVISVKLDSGWNTYGTLDELSPIQFSLDKSDGFEPIGKPTLPKGIEKDSVSGKRHFLIDRFEVRQQIKPKNNSKMIEATGSLKMVLCRKESCLPPKGYKFSVNEKPAVAATGNSSQPNKLDLKKLEKDLAQVLKRARASTVAITMGEGQMGGNGSAVIVSPDGLVLTAGHCFGEPDAKAKIILHDGREFSVTGLGLEPRYDCGLMKIDPKSLGSEKVPYSEIGWSSQLQTNEPLFSIAHGGMYNEKRGAYLRFGRVVNPCSEFNGFIQSTCLMEPGDSGGPLFNLDGRVVGIRSMIQENLDENYDVPVCVFRRYWAELSGGEKLRWNRAKSKPDFGMRLMRSRNRVFSTNNSSRSRGIRILNVKEDGWAAAMGLKSSDRITDWDGVPVSDTLQLNLKMIGAFATNSKPKIKVNRKESTKTLTLDFSQLTDSTKILDAIQPDKSLKHAGKPQKALAKITNSTAKIESQLDDLCVTVTCDSEESFATLVFWSPKQSSDSNSESTTTQWAVGKSSRLKEDTAAIKTESGKSLSATVETRDEKLDLALLKLSEPIKISRNQIPVDESLAMGQFLISASPKDKGYVSVQSASNFSTRGRGQLGVFPKQNPKAFVIQELVPDHAAEKAGLKVGDQLLGLDETPINSLDDALTFLGKTKPEQVVNAKIKRDSETLDIKITLGYETDGDIPMMHVADEFEGGKSRTTRFPNVILHDGPVLASHCGGPVFDLRQNFVGINIARKSRTRSYILPAKDVIAFTNNAMKN